MSFLAAAGVVLGLPVVAREESSPDAPAVPQGDEPVAIFINGLMQEPGHDYVISDSRRAIVFDMPTRPGDVVMIQFEDRLEGYKR